MGIQVVWDDEAKSILRWDFETDWGWDDFRRAFEKSVDMGGDVGYRVDVIPYAGAIQQLPMGALREFQRIERNLPDNTGLIVITGGNTFTNAIINVFAKVNRINTWMTAKTLEDARAIIARDREKP